MAEISPETWLISGGRSRRPGDPLNAPIVPASNFFHGTDRIYARGEGTETVDAFEQIMGRLEGGPALAFSSGMAAVAAVLGGLPMGAVLAVPSDPYHGVKDQVSEGEAQGRWTAVRLDLADTDAWVAAAAEADLIWLESPANPLITVADLANDASGKVDGSEPLSGIAVDFN